MSTDELKAKFNYDEFITFCEENDSLDAIARALGSIADSQQRIAAAQETIAHLTNIDLDATIQEGSKILYAEMKAKENAGNAN